MAIVCVHLCWFVCHVEVGWRWQIGHGSEYEMAFSYHWTVLDL